MIANGTPGQRAVRLEQLRRSQEETIANETKELRDTRLQCAAETHRNY